LFQGLNYRDTDWFEVNIDEYSQITLTAVAEFPVLLFIIDSGSGDCSDYSIMNSASGNPCDTVSVSAIGDAGTYWMWIGPSVFDGVSCGSAYTMWVDAQQTSPPEDPCDGDPEPVLYSNGYPTWDNGLACDRWVGGDLEAWVVDDVVLTDDATLTGMAWWTVTDDTYDFENTDDFIILEDDGGAPGAVITEQMDVPNYRFATGEIQFGRSVYVYVITGLNVNLPAGTYWIGMRPVNQGDTGQNFWAASATITGSPIYFKSDYFGFPDWTPSMDIFGADYDVNFCLYGTAGPCVCDVSMVPDEDPVIVPAGGSFGVTGIIGNPCNDPMTTDVWYGVVGFGHFYEQGHYNNIPLNPGQYINGHLIQHVPGYAPAGDYLYCAYCGDRPNVKDDSFCFPFTVTTGRNGAGADEWYAEGGFINELPTNYALVGSYPNPFNATTTITYQLPEAGNVTLEVYNLMGQKVETLVNGYNEAGVHSVTWDAANYSSGVYFYKLNAGNKVFTARATLLK